MQTTTTNSPGIDPARSANDVIDALSACQRVLITTHVRPDGDALGSTAAMAMGLRARGIHCEALLLSKIPRKYAFLFDDNQIPYHIVGEGWPASLSIKAFDALLVVDTGTWSQLPGVREQIATWPGRRIVVDHHLTQEDWADLKFVRTTAAAAGELVAEILAAWSVPIDRAIATALFLAIASDTGWFQYSNTRPRTLRLAANLMEAGVDTDAMYQSLYQNERAERLLLQTRAQRSMELLAENRLAVMRLRRHDFEETHADVPDTENLVNVPLQIRTVEVSILIVEPRDNGPIRVSLRSKGGVDVARFSEQFGGGGHARAAGLKLSGALQEVDDRVVQALLTTMERPTVSAT